MAKDTYTNDHSPTTRPKRFLPIAGSVYPAIPSIVLVIALSSGPFFAHLVTGLEPSSIFERKQAVDASDRILGYILLHSVSDSTVSRNNNNIIIPSRHRHHRIHLLNTDP
ncbi:hypothetical protein QR685DRAFT_549222 [Neurospora intermedia]|uniref:Uncharacterized protein n=1 Tax=Neurospora intermedia TaxID=5142 RepID=A0ABR3DRB8_NEUIN